MGHQAHWQEQLAALVIDKVGKDVERHRATYMVVGCVPVPSKMVADGICTSHGSVVPDLPTRAISYIIGKSIDITILYSMRESQYAS